jgi:hypothetical protein
VPRGVIGNTPGFGPGKSQFEPGRGYLRKVIMNNEKCILCDNETSIDKSTHIDYRYYYVEGVGQLCKECWKNTFPEEELVYYEE